MPRYIVEVSESYTVSKVSAVTLDAPSPEEAEALVMLGLGSSDFHTQEQTNALANARAFEGQEVEIEEGEDEWTCEWQDVTGCHEVPEPPDARQLAFFATDKEVV